MCNPISNAAARESAQKRRRTTRAHNNTTDRRMRLTSFLSDARSMSSNALSMSSCKSCARAASTNGLHASALSEFSKQKRVKRARCIARAHTNSLDTFVLLKRQQFTVLELDRAKDQRRKINAVRSTPARAHTHIHTRESATSVPAEKCRAISASRSLGVYSFFEILEVFIELTEKCVSFNQRTLKSESMASHNETASSNLLLSNSFDV